MVHVAGHEPLDLGELFWEGFEFGFAFGVNLGRMTRAFEGGSHFPCSVFSFALILLFELLAIFQRYFGFWF